MSKLPSTSMKHHPECSLRDSDKDCIFSIICLFSVHVADILPCRTMFRRGGILSTLIADYAFVQTKSEVPTINGISKYNRTKSNKIRIIIPYPQLETRVSHTDNCKAKAFFPLSSMYLSKWKKAGKLTMK